ncbi:MAG: toluene tolerance protein [Gammaproteobacteria bacterium]|nr:MAG: toluene tolerance protein [Gammaproteobacteria bacterium]PHR83556.1 MAG: toluene tolerance protein [Colwellia sp.]
MKHINKIKLITPSLLILGIVASLFSVNILAYDEAQANKLSEDKVQQSTNTGRIYVDKKNPYLMIKSVASKTFKRFSDEHQAIQANPNRLKDIVREELMPYINYKYSAFKVIGKHLKKTTAQERKDFVPVFREYLVTSYAQVFTLYDNQPVEFAPEKNFSGKKIIAVKTRVIMQGRDDIDVSFKVRRNRKTNEWKAFDMIAEGVSLLDSKQAELGGIIRQKGLPYVTELLKKKSERDIVFKTKSVKNKAG